ncbi:hypothetical protein BKA80DRAFT_70420 [Phyllosticta citrichinensis]
MKRAETVEEDKRQTKVQAKQTRYVDGRSAQAHNTPTNQTTRDERRGKKVRDRARATSHDLVARRGRAGNRASRSGTTGTRPQTWRQPTKDESAFFFVASNEYSTACRGSSLCGASQSERRQSTRERHGGRVDSAAWLSGARARKARTEKRQRVSLCIWPATTSSGRSGCTSSFSFCFSYGSTRAN